MKSLRFIFCLLALWGTALSAQTKQGPVEQRPGDQKFYLYDSLKPCKGQAAAIVPSYGTTKFDALGRAREAGQVGMSSIAAFTIWSEEEFKAAAGAIKDLNDACKNAN